MDDINIECSDLEQYSQCRMSQDVGLLGPATTESFIKMLQPGVYHLFVSRTGDHALTDLPASYGEMILLKISSTNFSTAWFISTAGATYKYKYHDTDRTGSGWIKIITEADLGCDTISSGSIKSIKTRGIYYISNSVADKPVATGGMYILASANNDGLTQVGLYIPNANSARPYVITCVNGTWFQYQL